MLTIDLGSFTAEQGVSLFYPSIVGPRQIGQSVGQGGDFNNDGIGDFVIGSGNVGLFVVYGRVGGLPSSVDLSALTAAQGFAVTPASGGGTALTGHSAGDINAHGIDDVVVLRTNAGAASIIYGQAGGIAGPIDLASLGATQGVRITGSTGLQFRRRRSATSTAMASMTWRSGMLSPSEPMSSSEPPAVRPDRSTSPP